MKKRMLSILLVAMMLFSTMSVLVISVSAAEDPYLKVAGATMTDGQYLVKGSVSPITELPANADSYAYYKDGILTLHNYSLNASGMTKLIEANGKLSLKILLEGENILKGNSEETTAIWANYEVDIMGSGSLTISNVAYGIDRSDNSYAKPPVTVMLMKRKQRIHRLRKQMIMATRKPVRTRKTVRTRKITILMLISLG